MVMDNARFGLVQSVSMLSKGFYLVYHVRINGKQINLRSCDNFFMCFGRFKIDGFSEVRGNFRLDLGTSGLELFWIAPKHTPK